jgi:DUF1680 family protein
MKIIRFLFFGALAILAAVSCLTEDRKGHKIAASSKNLAVVATPSSSSGYRSAASLNTLNDGVIPTVTDDTQGGAYIGWSRTATHYVQYEWTQPVKTKEIALYWLDDQDRIRLPKAFRILYWNGSNFIPVENVSGSDLSGNQLIPTSFDEIQTTRLRLEINSEERSATGITEWIIYASEEPTDYPPVVNAGVDRDVMLNGKTYLSGLVKSLTTLNKTVWSKESGPGKVKFGKTKATETTAVFSTPGNYVLTLTANAGKLKSSSSLNVKVHEPPPAERLNVVYTKHYSINNPLWNARIKAIIVNWIPHCIDQINRTDLTRGEGGIDNFIEAAKALRGEPHGPHKGYVFSNAWVHQTIESMCIAMMVDPRGDRDIIAAHEKMKATIEDWIPKILAAQEPDGYLQTAYTLRDTSRWHERWSPENRGTHEGYVAGYFIESAINHYTLTEGKDKRLYEAAKKLADCWVANIGPGKKEWYDGHQEMEQALVRFGRFVNDMEGNGRGDPYISLAKFLLDSRGDGDEYDQSHLPVQQQYEAAGHAVRAIYSYSGMADIAAETGDVDYQSAVMSLWNNIVNKKYYVTGGIGSGETSEGFGPNYSLRNNAYCESCSSCGMIFFQYKMNLAYQDAKYADLYEETMYNALLGSLDLEGKNFYYTNPLVSSHARDPWHVCPCCVGNIPRTLLMIPTWTYVKSTDGIYVNLFIGSTIMVENVAGTNVEMTQKTDYPWKGNVTIVVNPEQSKEFTIYIRVPNRTTSELYIPTPQVSELQSIAVNGKSITPKTENGYVAITRTWQTDDKIDLQIPMIIQRIKPDEKIEADRGMVALRYGPLIYNVETADQPNINQALGSGPLSIEWRDDLLDGVMTIRGSWTDGTQLTAIPNYARNNRNTQPADREPVISMVWIKNE